MCSEYVRSLLPVWFPFMQTESWWMSCYVVGSVCVCVWGQKEKTWCGNIPKTSNILTVSSQTPFGPHWSTHPFPLSFKRTEQLCICDLNSCFASTWRLWTLFEHFLSLSFSSVCSYSPCKVTAETATSQHESRDLTWPELTVPKSFLIWERGGLVRGGLSSIEQERFPANLYWNAHSGEGEGKWSGPKVSLGSRRTVRQLGLRQAMCFCSLTTCVFSSVLKGVFV